MLKLFECGRCHASNRVSQYAQRESRNRAMNERCQACGASHCVRNGVVIGCISEEVYPLDAGNPNKPSAWYIHSTRPYRAGLYDCKFLHMNVPVRLLWTGTRFVVGIGDHRPVRMDKFSGWRGLLA